MNRADGFRHQRLQVVPAPQVSEALAAPMTSQILVTDAGHYPHAEGHYFSRPAGTRQAIIIIAVAGSGWFQLGVRTGQIRAGQALILPAGLPHSYGAAADDPWSIWWLHVQGHSVNDLVNSVISARDGCCFELGELDRPVSLIDEALTILEAHPQRNALAITGGIAWHLLTLLAASWPHSDLDPVDEVVEYVRARLHERMAVPQLAERAGLSASHFATVFRRRTGCGVTEFITRLRMAEARRLLDTTDLPIGVVAHRVGYEDPFYFSRQFHRLHELSPSAYRAGTKG